MGDPLQISGPPAAPLKLEKVEPTQKEIIEALGKLVACFKVDVLAAPVFKKSKSESSVDQSGRKDDIDDVPHVLEVAESNGLTANTLQKCLTCPPETSYNYKNKFISKLSF